MKWLFLVVFGEFFIKSTLYCITLDRTVQTGQKVARSNHQHALYLCIPIFIDCGPAAVAFDGGLLILWLPLTNCPLFIPRNSLFWYFFHFMLSLHIYFGSPFVFGPRFLRFFGFLLALSLSLDTHTFFIHNSTKRPSFSVLFRSFHSSLAPFAFPISHFTLRSFYSVPSQAFLILDAFFVIVYGFLRFFDPNFNLSISSRVLVTL